MLGSSREDKAGYLAGCAVGCMPITEYAHAMELKHSLVYSGRAGGRG